MSRQFEAIPAATVATANFTSSTFDMSLVAFQLGNIGFQINATGLSTADSTVKMQHSNDATNWVDVDNSTLTLAAGTSTQTLLMINQSFVYYQVVYTKNTNSAGTIQSIVNFQ